MSLIKATAIHEAAHIVIAYYYGYPPIEVRVYEDGTGDFRPNFGDNQEHAFKLMEKDVDETTFTIIGGLDEKVFQSIAQDCLMILIAGGVAEAIYRNTLNSCDNSQIELKGKDLRQAEAISRYLGVDIEEEKKYMYECLKGDIFWKAIINLSEKIMSSESLKLNHEQIKSSLEESGFTSFMRDAYCVDLTESNNEMFQPGS